MGKGTKTKKGKNRAPKKEPDLVPVKETVVVDRAGFDRRPDLTWALCCALTALVAYITTLPASITFEDSGHFVGAAATLGIAHPPGYPLYTMLGYLFTLLPIDASVAWKVNLCSAFCSAVAVFFLFGALRKLSVSRVSSALGALSFAFSATFWSQSIVAEVYSMNAMFLAILVDQGLALSIRFSAKRFLVSAFVFGLGMTNHYLLALAFPALILLAWPGVKQNINLRLVGKSAGAFALGLTPYLYLPIAASRDPLFNWGNPSTWDNFWYFVSRKQFKGADVAEGVQLSERLAHMGHLLKDLVLHEMPLVVTVLAIIGGYVLWRTQRSRAAAFVWLFAVNTIVLLFLLSFHNDPSRRFVFRVYPLGAWMAVAMMAGYGLHTLFRSRNRWVEGIVAVLVLGWGLGMGYSANRLTQNSPARMHASAILQQLPETAALIGFVDDMHVFPIAYAHLVEKERPDLLILDGFGLVMNKIGDQRINESVVRTRSGIDAVFDKSREAALEQGRPIYYMSRPQKKDIQVRQEGMLFADSQNKATHEVDFQENYHDMLAIGSDQLENHMARALVGMYHVRLGALLAKTSEDARERAKAAFSTALDFAGGVQLELLASLMISANRHGFFEEGTRAMEDRLVHQSYKKSKVLIDYHFSRMEFFRAQNDEDALEAELKAVLDVDPGYAPAQQELTAIQKRRKMKAIANRVRSPEFIRARDLAKAGKCNEAVPLFDALVEKKSSDQAWAMSLRGFCHMQAGRRDEAIRDMEAAIRIEPDDERLKTNLEIVRQANSQ